MRILCIRLLNLNSLRGEITVDFTKEPLASAGLFAITGSTGAGKSTLLDAITLALYGRAARYASQPSPEDIMTRHCGECSAEVTFEVDAGIFRAQWELRRARKKPDGRVQAPTRHLYDANQVPIADKIAQVDEKIAELTGLDYERFLRSVLLAQGEFARFLKAKSSERADLLENLTGTEIYSELSQLAHDLTRQHKSELETQEQLLGQIALLTEDQRAEHKDQIQRKEAELELVKARITAMSHRLGQARQLISELQAEAALREKDAALNAEQKAAQPDLARLDHHRQTLPFAEDMAKLDSARQISANAEQHHVEAQRNLATAQNRWLAAIASAHRHAESTLARKRHDLDVARENERGITAKLKELDRWLETNKGDATLENHLDEIGIQLSRLADERLAIDRCRKEQAAIQQRISSQQGKINIAQTAAAAARQSYGQREAEYAQAKQSLESILGTRTAESRRQHLQILNTGLGLLLSLKQRAQTWESQYAGIATQKNQLDNLAKELLIAEAAQSKADAETALASRNDEQLQAQLQQARLIASLESHRPHLKDGEPCPLCGALAHPYAAGVPSAQNPSTLEAQVTAARATLDAANKTARHAAETATRLKANHDALLVAIIRLEKQLETDLAGLRCEAADHGIEDASSAGFDLAVKAAQQSIQTLNDEIAKIAAAEKRGNEARTALLESENTLNAASRTLESAIEVLQDLQGQLTKRDGELAQLQAAVQQAATDSARLLHIYSIELPPAGEETEVLKALRHRKHCFQLRSQERTTTHTSLEKARDAIARQENETIALESQIAPYTALWNQHAQAIAALADDLIARETAAIDSFVAADRAAQERLGKLTGAEEAAATRQREKQEADTTLSEFQAALQNRLAGSSFSTIVDLRAARLPEAEMNRIEKLEKDLQSRAAENRSRLNDVRSRISTLRGQSVPEGEEFSALERNLADEEKLRDAAIGAINDLAGVLKRDDANRAQHDKGSRELEERRKKLSAWQQLDELIGAADGSKFRTYAQGISLEILLHHANAHLHQLTDRYQMRRSLTEKLDLEIEDLYQAGTRRPMASLSGGESFLASLALALGLAELAGRKARIDSLFIDEGFGSLDADTLEVAISALETLRQTHKTVGVISHVGLLKERIATQIQVEKLPGGHSRVAISGSPVKIV